MNKSMRLIALLLFFLGIGIIFYPHIRQFLYERYTREVISDFQNRIKKYQEDNSLEWLYLLMKDYNKELYENEQHKIVDPFSFSGLSFSLREFGFEEEMIGFITIPKMNVQLPIYLGASDINMERGAVHLTNTSLPIGGKNTNTVIAAHRGMSTARMFRDIERLELGDKISITNFYQTIYYEVIEIKIIYPNEIDTILIQSGRDLLTLVTCHPYRSNRQRYIVVAERIR